MIELGIDSFATTLAPPSGGVAVAPRERLRNLLAEIELADQAGLDAFGVGEHHRAEFVDSAPTVILGAAAARTARIRLASAVTVLSAADPVRVLEEFATLDLISSGRVEIIAGRGSATEAFPLFGFDLADYDSLFAEKLELLLRLRENPHVHWTGRHRPALGGQGVFPRPLQAPLPVWLGVGGTPQSFIRAGTLGLPLMIAIIGGDLRRFRPLVDLYREAGRRAGFAAGRLKVGVHAIGYPAETDQQAADEFYPGWAHSFTEIGRERGWRPATRAQYDAALGPTGAYLIGGAATVAEKILNLSEALGGVSRVSFQMSVAAMPHARMLRAIEILGAEVAPAVRAAAGAEAAAKK
jgi:probable LLM family oxidoreductase